ncbi:MAG: hypothetical protein K6E29_00770, partial [Cyanobacteria bacterium RUI128]|nr:hypothetical protein [Cyanobacteria bacterium RUI128]
ESFMSENLENQAVEENVTDAVSETGKTEENTVLPPVNNEEEQPKAEDTEKNDSSVEMLSKIFQSIADKKRELDEEIKSKQEYLSSNLGDYNTENYLQNQEFRNLYSEAFNALGTKLDTKKFVNLLDKYVEARIAIHNRNKAIKSENDSLTDSFDFKSGASKTESKLKRLQDIPDDELESYIAKYI